MQYKPTKSYFQLGKVLNPAVKVRMTRKRGSISGLTCTAVHGCKYDGLDNCWKCGYFRRGVR